MDSHVRSRTRNGTVSADRIRRPNVARSVVALFALCAATITATGEQPSRATSKSSPGSDAAQPTSASAGTLVEGVASYNYLCFLPKDYARQPKLWPLIIFLHGRCEDEDLEKLKHFGPIKFALAHDDFPFIVVAPATSRGWSVRLLGSFLDRIQTRFSVDRDRVYLTGLSMGGHATWALATFSPNRFAAIAPVAGAGNPRLAAQRLRHLPAWIFHGEKDTIVPVKCGLMMIEALKAGGAEVKSTIYPDRGHDSWDPAYDNRDLYAWFLKHRRYQGQPTRRSP